MKTLRPYQDKAVGDILLAYKQAYRSVLLQVPTGGGKTVIFSHIARRIGLRGKRVLILAHRDFLIGQISAALTDDGVYHGIVAAGYRPDYSANVIVGGIGTVVNRLHLMGDFDYIIMDECHHAVANSWREVLAAFPASRILGVTATPSRADGVGLGTSVGGIFEVMVNGPTVKELIGMGALVKPRVIYPGEARGFDDSGLKRVGGDYVASQLFEKLGKASIIGDAIAHYEQYSGGRQLRCSTFCINVKHAEQVAEMYRAAGYNAAAIYGSRAPEPGIPGMDTSELKRRIEDFKTGRLQILTSCELIGEGFDLPGIEIVQKLRPTDSLALDIQQGGRGLRPVAGKEECIILDHVGNVIKHGPPDRDRTWTLDGETKAERRAREVLEPPLIQCMPGCGNWFDAAAECPACHKPVKAKTELPKIKGGTLVEWNEAGAMAAMSAKERAAAEKAAVAAEKLAARAAKDAEREKKQRQAAHIAEAKERRVAAVAAQLAGLSGFELRDKVDELARSAKSHSELFILARAAGLKNEGVGNNKASAWAYRKCLELGIQIGRQG